MPKYTTTTSDKKKKTALKWWAIGCLGIFGLENFYVGKIKKGIIRFTIGIFILLSFYAMSGDFEGVSRWESFSGRLPLSPTSSRS